MQMVKADTELIFNLVKKMDESINIVDSIKVSLNNKINEAQGFWKDKVGEKFCDDINSDIKGLGTFLSDMEDLKRKLNDKVVEYKRVYQD